MAGKVEAVTKKLEQDIFVSIFGSVAVLVNCFMTY